MSSDFIDREGDAIGIALVTCDINQQNAVLYATDADMEFIANAREDIPILLAEVRQLRMVISDSRRAVAMWRWLISAGWDNQNCRDEARQATNDLADTLATLEAEEPLREAE